MPAVRRRKQKRALGWEDTPVGERPRMVSPCPEGFVYFRKWRSLRWFLLLVPPVLASGSAVVLRGQGWVPAVFVIVGGHFIGAALFVVLASGMSSSNWGTYFRSREPLRYWLDVAILATAYFMMCVCGYFLHVSSPGATSP